MKRLIPVLVLSLIAFAGVIAQKSGTAKKDMARLIDEQFNFAALQYKILSKNVPADLMPKTFNAKSAKVETRGCLKSRIDCHIVPIAIGIVEILAINLIAFGKLRLTILLRQPQWFFSWFTLVYL